MGEQGLTQKTRKRINRFFLDNKQSNCVLTCYAVMILLIVLLLSTAFFTSTLELDLMQSENQSLREMLMGEIQERTEIDNVLLKLEEELNASEQQRKDNQEILRKKEAAISDLEVGVATLEFEVRQLQASMTKSIQDNASTMKKATVVNNALPRGKEDTEKKEAVKEGFLHAWNSYKKYAWGQDELLPRSKSGKDWLGLGMTIVDSLDTLWIMDLKDDFKLARDWIAEKLNFDIPREVSFFETAIRELGGLLSAYELSKDKMFLDKAEDIGARLLKAFDSPSGIPYSSINLRTGHGRVPTWTQGGAILSEIGTVQLEYLYLAYHTNKPHYAVAPLKVFRHLDGLQPKDPGLYPVYVNVNNGQLIPSRITAGALGDSFYEYLVKMWMLTNKQAEGYRRMYEQSAEAIKKVLVQTSPSGYRYVSQTDNSGSRIESKMEHLTCFTGGMYALGAVNKAVKNFDDHMDLAADITESCHESYNRTKTQLGPETFEFNGNNEFIPAGNSKYYILRPETVESYFVLWRTTKDPKYRKWAWEAFQAIEKHCRGEFGYHGLHDVNVLPAPKDDTQQSFFLAETLKYLYLIFCDDDVIPLDKYVFNTEAHPLGIITEPLDLFPQELRFTLLEI